MANSPTYFRTEASVTARKAEVPLADFDGGMNRGGACAPGIGIATDQADLDGDPSGWTLLDQAGAARTPQDGQHIGGQGLGGTLPASGGQEGAGTDPIRVATNAGDGDVTDDGNATLTDLATGWTAV